MKKKTMEQTLMERIELAPGWITSEALALATSYSTRHVRRVLLDRIHRRPYYSGKYLIHRPGPGRGYRLVEPYMLSEKDNAR